VRDDTHARTHARARTHTHTHTDAPTPGGPLEAYSPRTHRVPQAHSPAAGQVSHRGRGYVVSPPPQAAPAPIPRGLRIAVKAGVCGASKHSSACRLSLSPHLALPKLPQPWASILVPVQRLPVMRAAACAVDVRVAPHCVFLSLPVCLRVCLAHGRSLSLFRARSLSAVKSFIRDYADIDGGTSPCCCLAPACRLLAPGARRRLLVAGRQWRDAILYSSCLARAPSISRCQV
jgi:hypothetical protein